MNYNQYPQERQLYSQQDKQQLTNGLKQISQRLETLLSEEKELLDEINGVEDGSSKDLKYQKDLPTIFEQIETDNEAETEEDFVQSSFYDSRGQMIDNSSNIFRSKIVDQVIEQINNQITSISEFLYSLVDKYKSELQQMAFEMKQYKIEESQRLLYEQQKKSKYLKANAIIEMDFQALYEEEKSKLNSLECTFSEFQKNLKTLEEDFACQIREKSDISQNSNVSIKGQIENLKFLIKDSEEKRVIVEREYKEREKTLKNLRGVVSNLRSEKESLEKDKSEKEIQVQELEKNCNKAKKENARLTSLFSNREQNYEKLSKQNDDLKEQLVNEKSQFTILLKNSQEKYKELQNVHIKLQQAYKSISLNQKQIEQANIEQEIGESKIVIQQLTSDIGIANQKIQEITARLEAERKKNEQIEGLVKKQVNKEMEIFKEKLQQEKLIIEKEALEYINYKEEEIRSLKNEISLIQKSSSQNQPEEPKNSAESIKGLQNLLTILSKDLLLKENEIQDLRLQSQQAQVSRVKQN